MESDTKLNIFIRDKHNRIIFKIIDDNVMVMRLSDMDQYTKDQLIYLYAEFTSGDVEKLRKFLNFENDSEENEFCS